MYYSGIYFDYVDCNVGGVELARQDPATGSWSSYQIRANSDTEFQDKPAVAVDRRHVYVSWTHYGSCTGVGVTSPIKIAVFPVGSSSGPPIGILSVPGSTYSQGSAIVADKNGGLWVAWEEFPSSSATTGSIWLAHWRGPRAGWAAPFQITDSNFKDLPSPLPGFAFRDNSFPAIAIHNGSPNVVWCSYDTGVGRCYWWVSGAYVALSDTGGDQFFPSIVVDTNAQFSFSWSQTNQATQTYDQYLRVCSAGRSSATTTGSPGSGRPRIRSGPTCAGTTRCTGARPKTRSCTPPDRAEALHQAAERSRRRRSRDRARSQASNAARSRRSASAAARHMPMTATTNST